MRTTGRTVVLIATLALSSRLAAQGGVTVQSSTDVRFMGALGTMVNLAAKFGGGGSMHDMPTTTAIAGHKLRTDTPDAGMIIDADAGRVTHIDHKNRSYTSMTFAEMAEAMRRAQQSASAQRQQEQAKDPSAPKGEMTVKPKVTLDRPGQHESVAGYDAERSFLTIELAAQAKPEGGEAQDVGTLVFLIDQWVAKDAPQGAALREFQRAYRQKAGQEFKSQVQAVQAAFAADPRIKDGFEAAAKEMQNQKGIPLRTATYVVLVPVGVTFDRQLALGDAAAAAVAQQQEDAKPKKGGLRGFMGKVKSAAEAAGKQSEQPAGPPKQSTMMALKDEVKTITPGAPSADRFAPPAGYREVKTQQP